MKEEGQFITSGNENGTSIQKQRLDLSKEGLKEEKRLSWKVEEKGYYCLASIPLTTLNDPTGNGNGKAVEFDQNSNHAKFNGRIFFHNKFEGNLPASEYPKLNVSLVQRFLLSLTYPLTYLLSNFSSYPRSSTLDWLASIL